MLERRKPWHKPDGQGMSTADVKARVLRGERPGISPDLRIKNAKLYSLVESAWSQIPLRRPTFSDIKRDLEAEDPK